MGTSRHRFYLSTPERGMSLVGVLLSIALMGVVALAVMQVAFTRGAVLAKSERARQLDSIRTLMRSNMDCDQTLAPVGGDCGTSSTPIAVKTAGGVTLVESNSPYSKHGQFKVKATCRNRDIEMRWQLEGTQIWHDMFNGIPVRCPAPSTCGVSSSMSASCASGGYVDPLAIDASGPVQIVSNAAQFLGAIGNARKIVVDPEIASLDFSGISFSGRTPPNVEGLVIEGNGKVIENLNMQGTSPQALLGFAQCVIIRNVTVQAPTVKTTGAGAAVFALTAQDSLLQRIVINSPTIYSTGSTGGVVALATTAALTDITVNGGTVLGDSAGGLAGSSSGGIVKPALFTGVRNSAQVDNLRGSAGGIVGSDSHTRYCDAQNSGHVEGWAAGGIVGYSSGGPSELCDNCINSGTIVASDRSSSVWYDSVAGGIFGRLDEGILSNSTNLGPVSGANLLNSMMWVGGIAGSTAAEVVDVVNEGDVWSNYYAGGIVGHLASGGAVKRATNKAKVTAANPAPVAGGFAPWAGGIAGGVGNYGWSPDFIVLENVRNEGVVRGVGPGNAAGTIFAASYNGGFSPLCNTTQIIWTNTGSATPVGEACPDTDCSPIGATAGTGSCNFNPAP